MKTFFLTTAFIFSAFVCVSAQALPSSAVENKIQAEIDFPVESHNLGTIKLGKQVSYEFVFKNVGTTPLIIYSAESTCGCTIATWNGEPIAPGMTGVIRVVYNSTGHKGSFHKSITVKSNAKTASKIIFIDGTVVSRIENL